MASSTTVLHILLAIFINFILIQVNPFQSGPKPYHRTLNLQALKSHTCGEYCHSLVIGIVKEIGSNEKRVGCTPETVSKLKQFGFSIRIETKAGEESQYYDRDFELAGGEIVRKAKDIWKHADIIIKVQPPTEDELYYAANKQTLISFIFPDWNQRLLSLLTEKDMSVFAMDCAPKHLTESRPFDPIFSQAKLIGFRAMIEAANAYGHILHPVITKPQIYKANSLLDVNLSPILAKISQPHRAEVLIIGAGTTGLSAAKTALSMGASVRIYDPRISYDEFIGRLTKTTPSSMVLGFKQQLNEMGAQVLFIQSGQLQIEDNLEEVFYHLEKAALTMWFKQADIVITSVMGNSLDDRRHQLSNTFISNEMVGSMKVGSVIFDVTMIQDESMTSPVMKSIFNITKGFIPKRWRKTADRSKSGGNCAMARPDRVVVHPINGVKILGFTDLPSRMPSTASSLFSKNVENLIQSMVIPDSMEAVEGGVRQAVQFRLAPNYSDPIVQSMLITGKERFQTRDRNGFDVSGLVRNTNEMLQHSRSHFKQWIQEHKTKLRSFLRSKSPKEPIRPIVVSEEQAFQLKTEPVAQLQRTSIQTKAIPSSTTKTKESAYRPYQPDYVLKVKQHPLQTISESVLVTNSTAVSSIETAVSIRYNPMMMSHPIPNPTPSFIFNDDVSPSVRIQSIDSAKSKTMSHRKQLTAMRMISDESNPRSLRNIMFRRFLSPKKVSDRFKLYYQPTNALDDRVVEKSSTINSNKRKMPNAATRTSTSNIATSKVTRSKTAAPPTKPSRSTETPTERKDEVGGVNDVPKATPKIPSSINEEVKSNKSKKNPFIPFLDVERIGLTGNWEERLGNYILRPTIKSESNGDTASPNVVKPIGVVHFLGGAFVGAAPHITYRYLLESLAEEGYLIVTTPFRLDMDYLRVCDGILNKFDQVAKELAAEYGPLPVIGLGHSCGALLQTLITSLFPDTPRAVNILISFNNRPASEAIPAFNELIIPLSEQLMSDSDPNKNVREIVEILRSYFERVLEKYSESSIAPYFVANEVLPFVKQGLEIVDQVPPLLKTIADGEREFVPSPAVTKEACRRMYRARSTLLIKFENDEIDESEDIEKVLREANTIMRMRRPMVEMEVQLKVMKGTHITPLTQKIFIEPRDSILPTNWEVESLAPIQSEFSDNFLRTVNEVKSEIIDFLNKNIKSA